MGQASWSGPSLGLGSSLSLKTLQYSPKLYKRQERETVTHLTIKRQAALVCSKRDSLRAVSLNPAKSFGLEVPD